MNLSQVLHGQKLYRDFNRERIFTYSETWGPFSCQSPDCKEKSWAIIVTQEELDQLHKENDGNRYEMHKAALNMGLALCGDHIGQYEAIKEERDTKGVRNGSN